MSLPLVSAIECGSLTYRMAFDYVGSQLQCVSLEISGGGGDSVTVTGGDLQRLPLVHFATDAARATLRHHRVDA